MKKIFVIITVVLAGVIGINAQSKIGYVNANEIVLLMPEMQKVTDSLMKFQKELELDGQSKMAEYQELQKKYEDQKKNGASETMLGLILDEINQKGQFLSTAQQKYQQAFAEVEAALMKPLEEKFMAAVKEVAVEKGMNYILDISQGTVLHQDEKDDVNKDVRKKLGISETAKLPEQGQ